MAGTRAPPKLVVIGAVGVLAIVVAGVGAAMVMLREPIAPKAAEPTRLLVSVRESHPSQWPDGYSLRVLDPDTLVDAPDSPPLRFGPCDVPPPGSTDPLRRTVLVTTNAGPMICPLSATLSLRFFDLDKWTWGPQVDLHSAPDRTLELAWTPPRQPIEWTADGSKVYVCTVSRLTEWMSTGNADEIRQLWIVDTSGATPPTAVQLEVAPWRLNLSPTGRALYVLGYQTRGPSRWGDFEPGSGVLLILDPSTGTTRSRVPLAGVKMGPRSQPGDSLALRVSNPWNDPGAAVARNGRYYFVAHPDEPIVEVVDVFAPGLERIERVVVTDSASNASIGNNASLSLSPDGRKLYVHRLFGEVVHVVDVGKWTVTADSTMTSLRTSPDGRWVYAIDPPRNRSPEGQILFLPNVSAGLRVLDASGQQVTRLLEDQIAFQLASVGMTRVYVVQAPKDQPLGAVARVEMVAYEVGSWQELARRELPIGSWIYSP